MAFALSLKSKYDFPGIGDIFLLLTLIVTAFTLMYSSFLMDPILYACGIIETEVKERPESIKENKNYFEVFKEFLVHVNEIHLLPYVRKDKEPENSKRLLNDFNKF
jgi:hypothetical protein